MLKKIYQIIFVFLFTVMLSLPMIKHIVSEDKIKTGENRFLAQKPDFPTKFNQIKTYIDKADEYLSDQFGFRRNFISGANKVRYKLFNEITSKQVTMGLNGFIYLNTHAAKDPNSLIKLVCNVKSQSINIKEKTKQYFAQLLDHSEPLNINIGIAIIPTKARIYPEFLPELERDWCTLKPPAWWEDMFQDTQQYSLYYPLEKMIELKDSMPVYLSKHFHWHGQLPYILVEDMMQSLWGVDSIINFEKEKTSVESDLKNQFQGLHFYDDSFNYVIDNNRIEMCEGHNCIEGIDQFYIHNTSYVYKNLMNKTKTKLVVLADSFGENIAMYFLRGFAEVYVIDINKLALDEQYKFYQWVTKTIKPTHLLHLMHDGGVIERTLKIERLMKDIDKFGF